MGRITKPHGIKGEVMVLLVTDRTERLAPGTVLSTNTDRTLRVLASSPHQHGFIVAFEGVHDRSGAEALRDVILRAEPIDDPDALWVHELIGSSVVDVDGNPLGTVASIEANPASDLLVLDGGGLVPVRFIVERRQGTITVDVPEGLLE